ncbi:MAG TPA: filamentous hemagglutinin N-terminal domain-containing protein, partial [Rhodocyclaceae bacterium]|nr:filamentous hemagglutinin N-terminal domain-containing protein [Rhodocyclaceae bacterium]
MATYLTQPMKSSRVLHFARRPLALAISLCFSAASLALPADPTVVAGSAAFQQNGAALTVTTTTHNAIIDWQKFTIGAGETTRFIQPAASSAVMNRVLAAEPSLIYGTLSSNGRVFLINPSGIMVGPSGRIDTQGFVASTLGISNQDFLAGRMLFKNNELNAPGAGVINQGQIVTPHGGSVYLIGGDVDNRGIIVTPHGETILAAGHTVSLIDSATPGVKVEITGAAGKATNLGEIVSTAGRIGIAGVIVKNSGSLNAAGAVLRGGRIFLQASQESRVDGQARIDASGAQGGAQGGAHGGEISVLGKQVFVTDQAVIDASGADGGGTLRIGGDYRGANPDVQNADTTFLGAEARLNADATKVGAGGTVVVWADDSTQALGHISARGGAAGGDGGLIETSGKRMLEVARAANASAPYGRGGTWLLDPNNVTIQATGSDTNVTGNPSFVSTADSAIITTATLQTALNNGTNVSIATSSGGAQAGDITLNSPLLKTVGGNATLTLSAHNNINLNQAITSSSGLLNLTLIPNSDASGGGSATVLASLTGIGAFTVGGAGSVTFSGGTSSFATSYSAASTSITGGNIAIATPLTLTSLQMSAGSLNSTALITLTGSGNWSGGALAGGGTLKIDNGATLNIEGASTKSLNGFNIDNAGTVVWKASGNVDLNMDGATNSFVNRNTFDIRSNAQWGNVFCCQSGSFTLTNLSGGLIKRTTDTGMAQFVSGSQIDNNAGATIDIQTGTLLVGKGANAGSITIAGGAKLESTDNFSLANASTIAGAGTFKLSSGTIDVQGNAAATNLTHSGGTLGGTGTLTLSGSSAWSGGAWKGGGTLKVGSGATLTIDGTATKSLNGYTLDNAGTLIWKSSGVVDLDLDGSSSALINRNVFDIQGSGSWGNVF